MRRRLLFRDRERLDALFVNLIDTFREGEGIDVRAMWTGFESELRDDICVEAGWR